MYVSELEQARRHIAPGYENNHLPTHKVEYMPGGVQDTRPGVKSGINQDLDQTGHSAIRLIRNDRPKFVRSMDEIKVETTADPSNRKPVVGVEGAVSRKDDTALAALAEVSYMN